MLNLRATNTSLSIFDKEDMFELFFFFACLFVLFYFSFKLCFCVGVNGD